MPAPATPPLSTASALWPELVAKAGLTGRRTTRQGAYDGDLVDSLRDRLFPRSTRPFSTLIARSRLSADDLLRAFFATLAPFAAMQTDILEMLGTAEACGSGETLSIAFDFERDGSRLELLLSQFRTQMEVIEEVSGTRPVTLDLELAWSLLKAGFEDVSTGAEILPPQLETWLVLLKTTGGAGPLPGQWRTGQPALDVRLERVVVLIDAVVAELETHGVDKAVVEQGIDSLAWTRPDVTRDGWIRLRMLGSDWVPKIVGQWLARVHGALGGQDRIAAIIARIDVLLPPDEDRSAGGQLWRALQDVLALPVWKHRHEVYAVWLGAQLNNVLVQEGWTPKYHLVAGRLEFAWRGVHLATFTRRPSEPDLYWWTELETRHPRLPSGKRKNRIKPDYRVRQGPISHPDPDILVLEAKQHRRSSTREFINALDDYAHGCSKAAVVLANHGPTVPGVLGRLLAATRRRCAAHGHVEPGCPQSVMRFRRDLVLGLRGGLAGDPAAALEVEATAKLEWGHEPMDLDLHVTAADPAIEHAYYQRMETPEVRLDTDVTTGLGPEVATFVGGDGPFFISVHQFSDQGTLCESAASVTFDLGARGAHVPVVVTVPPTGEGRWWHVAKVHPRSGIVIPISQIDDVPPDGWTPWSPSTDPGDAR